jgi:hypothetical protein
MKYQSFLSILTLILLSFAFIPVSASAQISSGIATYVQINDKDVQEGDVIKVTPKGYRKTTTAYEPSVFGVVTDNPSVSFENKSLPNGTAVISSGKVYVRVSGHNGPISKGDTLTTSIIPGVAQKATENGYVIGTAVESFPASKNSDTGKVLVVLNITYNSSLTTKTNNLFKLFTIAADAPYLSPVCYCCLFLWEGFNHWRRGNWTKSISRKAHYGKCCASFTACGRHHYHWCSCGLYYFSSLTYENI